MAKYRTKTTVVFYYGGKYETSITAYPQTKWELIGKTPYKRYRLKNKNVVMSITDEDFEKYFVEVKEVEE